MTLPIIPETREKPFAEVFQRGRRTWLVSIYNNGYRYGPDGVGWYSYGSQRRAEKKARKELRKYLAKFVYASPAPALRIAVEDLT